VTRVDPELRGGTQLLGYRIEALVGHDFSDLEQQVSSLVAGNLTRSDWQQVAAGIRYHTTCAG